MQKRFTTTRPKSDTNPTCVWLQLFDADDNLILQKKYNNISLIQARQRAYSACARGDAYKALVLRGGCNPENPEYADIWEDFTCEEGLKGFASVSTLKIKLGAPV